MSARYYAREKANRPDPPKAIVWTDDLATSLFHARIQARDRRCSTTGRALAADRVAVLEAAISSILHALRA